MDKIYAIVLKNPPKSVPTYVVSDECGYPYVTTHFSEKSYSFSIERLKDCIETYKKFNLWLPEEGFTSNNIQIVEVTLNFIPI